MQGEWLTSGFIIINPNAGVKWVRHACQGFEWVWDGFWVGFGRVWVGFGGFCVGFAWVCGLEVRLAGVWLGGAISKWDGQMFKILLPHGWLGGAISKWDGQMFKILLPHKSR